MRRDVRSHPRRVILALAGLAAVAALIASASAPAAPTAGATLQAGHTCLVMTGSGDPAFVKNFNPYTATGAPTGQFVRGAFYEPLIISSVAGGGHTYPWLAQSWKWSNGNKTLTLNLEEREVDGRKAAHLRGRGLQPHRGQAGQVDGHDRLRLA